MTKTLLAAALLFLVYSSCTDPITVGSELLDRDRAQVGQTTDVPFTTRVIRGDSLLTLQGTRAVGPDGYSFGRIDDMTFGTVNHNLYLTPQPPRTASGLTVIPPFVNDAAVRVDSVVLILPIDTLKPFYGPGRVFPFELRELAEPVASDALFYSDAELPTTGGNLAEQATFTASVTPAVVPVQIRDTVVTNPPLRRANVRIRMAAAFVDRANALRADNFETDSIFRASFPGVGLLTAGTSDGLVYLLQPQLSNDTLFRGFNYYYQDTSGRQQIYRIGFRQVIPSYLSDFDGSFVETLLEQETSDELVAVAGEGSLVTEFTLTGLDSLAGRVINRAELEIPLATVAGVDYSAFPPPTRVELFYRLDSSYLPITDRVELIRSQTRSEGINFLIGGPLTDLNSGVRGYSPGFSIHLQRMIDGEVPPRLYLRVTPLLNNEVRAGRALLNGPAAASNPARIRVTFTDID